jgi:hypothetical protein
MHKPLPHPGPIPGWGGNKNAGALPQIGRRTAWIDGLGRQRSEENVGELSMERELGNAKRRKLDLSTMVLAWEGATVTQQRAALAALQGLPMASSSPSAAPDEILTRKEVARRLHRHPSFVDRAVRKGLLTPWNPGGRWRRAPGFRASDVSRLIVGTENNS